MGVVYKAFDPIVERRVAIKTIRLDVEDAEDLANRLKREAKSVGQLEHPNIVTLYDAGESGGLFYLAMQFIQGETLQDRLNRQRWFTLKEVQELFRQICAGLDYAHQRGVIHRDIKPANIMVTHEGIVKLTDFGIAKFQGGGTSTSGLIVGTPSYMSPEQAVGKPLDGRSDIFSLGSILYELITGEKAFPGQNTTTVMYKIVHESPTPLAALQPGLDPAVEAIVLKALAKRPEDRFQSCSELAAALELYLNKAVAAMPRTSVAGGLSAQPVPSAVSPELPMPRPPTDTVPLRASAGVRSVASPAPGTAAPTTTVQTGVPMAWLGGGVLGTLLLVILILLVVQMRGPAPVVAPSADTSRTASSASSAQSTTPPQGLQPAAASSTQQVAPAGSTPAVRTSAPAQPATRQASKQIAAARRGGPPVESRKQDVLGLLSPKKPETAPAQPQNVIQPTLPLPETESFNSLLLKGDMAFQQSRYPEALAAYQKAFKLDAANREVRRKLAVVLTLLGRPEEARKYQ